MTCSREAELVIITLNELDELAHTLRRRLPSTAEERAASFQSYLVIKSALSEGDDLPSPSVSERISHERFVKSKDRQRALVARRTIFASGFSALERFLVLRTPGCTAKSNFGEIRKKLSMALGEEISKSPTFEEKWEVLDRFRIARNKIVHQCALIYQATDDREERSLLCCSSRPLRFEKVEGHEDLREIIIEESFLGEYFNFLQEFAIEVDSKLSGGQPC